MIHNKIDRLIVNSDTHRDHAASATECKVRDHAERERAELQMRREHRRRQTILSTAGL